MLTREQCPWSDYIVIDEETLEDSLSPDTPPEIRRLYTEFNGFMIWR